MRHTLLLALMFFCLLTFCAAQDVTPLNVKEGLWEETVTHSMTGMPSGANIPPDALAKMPPEQRARIEAMMMRVSQDQTPAQQPEHGEVEPPRRVLALHPEVGSGAEYHLSSAASQVDLVYAIVNVGQEADGYWLEDRTTMQTKNGTTKMVTKTLMVGDPPQPKRRIIQVNGLKPMEVPVKASVGSEFGGGKKGIALFLLSTLVSATDLWETNIEEQMRIRATKSIPHDNAGLAKYSYKESNRVHLGQVDSIERTLTQTEAAKGATQSSPAPTAATSTGEGDRVGWAANAVLVGAESVTVPAGTFECDHYTSNSNGKQTDVWISTKIPPFHLVKLTSPDANEELQKVLEHETSQITGNQKK